MLGGGLLDDCKDMDIRQAKRISESRKQGRDREEQVLETFVEL